MRFVVLIRTLGMAVVIAAHAAEREQKAALLDGVAAWVDGKPITVGEVYRDGEREFTRLAARREMGREEMRREQERLFRAILEDKISQELVLAFFRRQSAETGVSIPEQAVDRQAEDFIRKRFGGDRRAFLEALGQARMTFDEWRETIRRQLIVEQIRAQELTGKVRISPEAIRRYYEENQSEFEHPGQILLRRIILVGPDAESRSNELMDRLYRKEADFSALAREYSWGPEADQGGLWGWRDPEDLAEPLAQKLARAPEGGIVRVELGGEWHLVRLEARDRIGLDAARSMIEARLRREEIERLARQWIESLKEQFHVQYVEVSFGKE